MHYNIIYILTILVKILCLLQIKKKKFDERIRIIIVVRSGIGLENNQLRDTKHKSEKS
jgi:hypothetical protein